MPDAAKLRHVRRDPRVTVHLNGVGWDNDIVVAAGEARESDDPPAHEQFGYFAKYREAIEQLGMTPEAVRGDVLGFAADHAGRVSRPLTATRLRSPRRRRPATF